MLYRSKRLSVEDVKNIYFAFHPNLIAKSKFDFAYERNRKAQLNSYHNRSAKDEAEIFRLSLLKSALNEVLTSC